MGTAGSPTIQKLGGAGGGTVVVSGGQVFTTSTGQHIVVTSNAQTGTNTTGSHFVIGPGSRLATIGGQQVLIRTGPTNSVLTLASPGTPTATLQPGQLVKTTPASPAKVAKVQGQQTPLAATPMQVRIMNC